MKVIHSVGWYFPQSCGGTEVYVAGLTSQLAKYGVRSLIAAPVAGDSAQHYVHEQMEVFRYPFPETLSTYEVRNVLAARGHETFKLWLQASQAEIYHQHSWTSGCGIHHLRTAKELGMPAVVTLHVPSNICLRGTMMLDGLQVCDGEIRKVRCGRCWGTSRGIDQQLASILARLPLAFSKRTAKISNSRVATAMATPALVEEHRDRLRVMTSLADRVVAVSRWQYDALLRNGIDKSKLVLSRQGIAGEFQPIASSNGHKQRQKGKLRVGFFGRWDEVKGIHVIVEAVNKISQDINIELVIHASPPNPEGELYERKVKSLANGNGRIRFADAVPHKEVHNALSTFDVIAVPSQWLETGPMIVLEAHAAGVPVVGSDQGGIAEFVKHGVNGLLVPPRDVEAWTNGFVELCRDPDQLTKLRRGIDGVRTMEDVASDMMRVYTEVSRPERASDAL